MVTFLNPESLHSPGAAYSHSALVTAGSDLVFISGQIGIRPDGSLASGLTEQADQVFSNISALLGASGLGAADIVKLTMFVVAGHDIQAVRRSRSSFLGSHRPASTAVFVPQLADPAWLVEVEAVAARSGS